MAIVMKKETGQILIYAGAQYHYGYSSSPSPIWVESVVGDWVTFFRYPYGDKKQQREHIQYFRLGVQKGTQTKLAALERYAATCTKGEYGYPVPEWCKELVAHYRAVLAGREGKKWDRDDIRMVEVEFTYNGEGDGWSLFEQTYPNSVGGSCERDGRTIYDTSDFSKAGAAELCHKMNTGQMPGFEFVSMKHREE